MSSYWPTSVPASTPGPLATYNVLDYTAYGDGIHDDTAAIQAAINAANGVAWVYLPHGTYLLSSALTSAGAAKRILLMGDGGSSVIQAGVGQTGYLVTPTASYDIRDLAFSGTSIDGQYGFGTATTSTHLRGWMDNVAFAHLDFGVRFTGDAVLFSLGARHDRIYCYNIRTCGIYFDVGTSATGQSNFKLDNIIVTNGGSPVNSSISASGVVVADDVTATTDRIDWTLGTPVFGWTIMRRTRGSVDANAWEAVTVTGTSDITYTATKVALELWDYSVVRCSVGLYCQYVKNIDIGTIQCEYVGYGVRTLQCYGVNIGTYYTEWRGGALATPAPRGDGIFLQQTYSFNVGSVWADSALSAVSVSVGTGTIQGARALDCSRSGVYLNQTDNNQQVICLDVQASGTTPVPVLTNTANNAAYNYIGSARDVALFGTAGEWWVDNVTASRIKALYRGAAKVVLEATSSLFSLWMAASTIPAAAVADRGKIARAQPGGGAADTLQACILDSDGVTYRWARIGTALTGSATYNAPNILASGTTTTTVTVTGAAAGDFALVSLGVDLVGLVVTAYATANTVTAVLFNPTGGAIDLAETTIRVWVVKR